MPGYDELVRSPAEQFRLALAAGDGDAAKRVWATFEPYFRGRPVGEAATAGVETFLIERHGVEARDRFRSLLADRGATLEAELEDGDLDAYGRSWQPEMDAVIDAGDHAAAVALFDRLEAAFRRVHDYAVDLASLGMSFLYREFGIDELERSLRDGAERTIDYLIMGMQVPIEQRVEGAARFLQGNFGTVTDIVEDETTVTVVVDPCGSCGRQAVAGKHEPPLDLATVTERHPLTLGHGDSPVYRTHVPVLHYLVPLERIGVPCPAVVCPQGFAAGPCRLVLYKDPRDPAACDLPPARAVRQL